MPDPARNEHDRAGPTAGRNRVRQPVGRGRSRLSTTGDDRGPQDVVSAELPWPGRGHRRHRGARQLRQLRPQRQGQRRGRRRRHCRRGHLLVPHRPARPADPPGFRGPVQQGQPRRPDQGHDLPERRVQDEDQDGHRRRPGANHHLGLGRRRSAQLRPGRPGRGPHLVVRRERRGQGPPVPLLLRGRDDRRQDLRDAGRDGPAHRALLEQEALRQGRRPAAAVLGRHHEPGAEVQRRRGRLHLPGRAVAVDQHDVAGVPLRPHRRPRGLPGGLRRREGRLVQPGVHRGADQGAGAHQGQRLRQGLLLHHRRLQRRPGAAVHRQGRDDAPRHLDLREHEGSRRRLRQRRPPRLHELPGGRGRQGRLDQHGRQPRPVLLDLVQGHRCREGDRQEVLLHRRAVGRRGQGVDRQRRGADRQGHRQPARRLQGRRVPHLRLRHRQQRQGLRPVLGPGPQPHRRREAARQHRQAVPAVDHTAAVRRQHEPGHRAVTTLAPPALPETRSATSRGRRSGALTWMALPALLVFVAFAIVPLVGVLLLSFTSWDGIGVIRPAGFDSWRAELTDPGLPHALWVTFVVMALSWAVQTPLSILLGVFLAGHQRYREFLAVLFFIPLLLSSAAIAITYKALLDPNFGLGAGLHLPLLTQDWLGDTKLAVAVIIFVVSWQSIPFHTLIYQGAVRQIPRSMYEAAQLDGAGRVRMFFRITLPQLKYTIITSSTLVVVGSLVFFDLIFVLTEGGPGDATRNLALDMYKRGFQANLMGQASAIAVILVLVGLALALLLRRIGGGSSSTSQLEGV